MADPAPEGRDAPLTVLKLGGSVVTRKDEPETVDEVALDRASETIAAALDGGDGATSDPDGGDGTTTDLDGGDGATTDLDGGDGTTSDLAAGDVAAGGLVLVHGGGSFGHFHADRHGVSTTAGTRDPAAIVEVHAAMTALNAAVRRSLLAAGVPAVPVRPFSAASRDRRGGLAVAADPIRTMLGEGFVPTLHGDVVAHAGEGATILSGDELVVALAEGLDADRVGLCSGVPGVLDEEGTVIERIDAFEDAAAALGGSDATDVTGGMAGKVRSLLGLDATSSVFGSEDLDAFLAGEDPGTSIGYQE